MAYDVAMAGPARDDVLRRIRAHESEIRAAGVRSLSLFGSVRRGDAHAGSDVDLLVEFDRVPGIFGFIDLRERLSAIVGAPVDLVPRDGLKPRLRDGILGLLAVPSG